jgi:hypothetical protein
MWLINRDKSPVWAMFVEIGYTNHVPFVCATQGKKEQQVALLL